jgi:hypothetical protein
MRKKLAISLAMSAMLLTLVSIALITQVHAEENPWVSTWDANVPNTPKDTFNLGEDVLVKAYNNPNKGPYDLILKYPGGSEVTLASGLTGYHEHVYPGSKMTPLLGEYTLKAGSASVGYASLIYTAIHELALGTILATVASFGAVLGLAGTKRLRLRH